MEHEEILSWAGTESVLRLAGLSSCPCLTRMIALKESLVQTACYFTLGMIHFLKNDQRSFPFFSKSFFLLFILNFKFGKDVQVTVINFSIIDA